MARHVDAATDPHGIMTLNIVKKARQGGERLDAVHGATVEADTTTCPALGSRQSRCPSAGW